LPGLLFHSEDGNRHWDTKRSAACRLLHTGLLHGLLFETEVGGD
jgi:hypothetical protein